MFNWTLKHRDSGGANVVNPDRVRNGYYLDPSDGSETVSADHAYSDYIPVIPAQVWEVHPADFYNVIFYTNLKEFISSDALPDSDFTVPASCYFVRITFDITLHGITNFEELGATLGAASSFEDYYTRRATNPLYSKAQRIYDLESGQQFYRDKLTSDLEFKRGDYDYLYAIPFETKIMLEVQDTRGILPDFQGYFYKADCKWDEDNSGVEVKVSTDDNYDRILGSLDKTYNLIEVAPATQSLGIRRRPLIQVYIMGDKVITNILGGTWWEQQLQIDPVFSNTTLTNTYRFFNTQNIRLVQSAYSTLLSTDVTGTYDNSRVNLNGLYRVDEDTDFSFSGFTRRRYRMVRIAGGVTLYQTQYSDWRTTSIGTLLFEPVGGETGSFYFTEYRIYVRYATDLLDVGVGTYPVPSTDIVPNNNNYRRVIGYDIPVFQIYEGYRTFPTKFGRVPDDAPNAGLYYREFLVSVASGVSNPLPISPSNWRAVSLWFFNDINIRYTEFNDGEDYEIKDTYPLHEVIQALLNQTGTFVRFQNTPEFSEVLYDTPNPLGSFSYLDFDAGGLSEIISGNISHFISPKSNIITGNYDQPAQRAEISLGQVLNALRDIYKIYWMIEGDRLRLEHITWFQNGGTYGIPAVSVNLTTLVNPKNNLSWGYGQNNYDYDKEAMPERFEFGWMDDVSRPFEGFPIIMNSEFVQEGKIEDTTVNGFTTDVDFLQANPQTVSKDGFCLLCAIVHDGNYRIPYIEADMGSNQEVVLQNGFLSWLYLHPKFHTFDKPTNNVNLNNVEGFLLDNTTREKKQDIEFPVLQTIDPVQLITTQLGSGKIFKMTIDMTSYFAKATIKHDTQ